MRKLKVFGGAFLCIAIGLLGVPAAAADPADPGVARRAAGGTSGVAAPSSGELGRGPSLSETGRIGIMPLATPAVPASRVADPRAVSEPPMRAERLPPDEGGVAADAPYPGTADAAILEREISARFAPLAGCRAEVAARQRVPVSTVRASQLTLRWTILPSGAVEETDVVATAAADPSVLNCVKRHMSVWSFTPADGGAARIERPFVFP